MLLSQALGLNRGQPALDFVDIDLATDTPLFLDPAAFYEGEGRFAEQCSRDLEEFFEAVLHAAGQQDWDLGLRLLRGLTGGRGVVNSLLADLVFTRMNSALT